MATRAKRPLVDEDAEDAAMLLECGASDAPAPASALASAPASAPAPAAPTAAAPAALPAAAPAPPPPAARKSKKKKAAEPECETRYEREDNNVQPQQAQPRVTIKMAAPRGVGDALRQQIRECRAKREAEAAAKEADAAQPRMAELIKEAETRVEVVRKDKVFADRVTAVEKDIIEQRTLMMQERLKEFERRERLRKYRVIAEVHPFVTEDEAELALKEHGGNEDEVVAALTENPLGIIQAVRRQIARTTYRRPAMRATQVDKKRISSKGTNAANPGYVRARLRLDDALALGDQSLWSPARINAYKQIDVNPNSYYYRFNAPGEAQRNGKWTPEEKTMFFDRMREVGVNGQWGIFSMAIPGRVGYQCSNFYRQLIMNNEVHDPNYIKVNGKLKFLFTRGQNAQQPTIRSEGTRIPNARSGRATTAARPPAGESKRQKVAGGDSKKKRTKKRRKSSDDLSDFSGSDWEDHEYKPRKGRSTRTRAARTGIFDPMDTASDDTPPAADDPNNPLPDFVDPFTLEPVTKPAISPYGHVAGYDGWVRALVESKKCPFTKNPLQPRELVKLTRDNIEEYRAKIVNV